MDYLKRLNKNVLVIKNDEKSIEEIKNMDFDAIVISPGPKTPNEAGINLSIVKEFEKTKPILGVCLGHQAIGMFYGAQLIHAKKPMHGKISEIFHNEKSIFSKLPNPLKVCRYHSLILSSDNIEKLPFEITSKSIDNEPMSIQHKTLPIVGIQFHPEAILTEVGLEILKKWVNEFL